MRKLPLTAFFLLLAVPAFTQTATSFPKAISAGISIHVLDSLYKPALSAGADSLQAVFRGKENEFYRGYVGMIKSLGAHLKVNGFSWSKQTRCFNRIYINERGTIDYFLFNFKPGELVPEKELQFENLLSTFIKDYKFPLPAPSKFAQCSPVMYSD